MSSGLATAPEFSNTNAMSAGLGSRVPVVWRNSNASSCSFHRYTATVPPPGEFRPAATPRYDTPSISKGTVLRAELSQSGTPLLFPACCSRRRRVPAACDVESRRGAEESVQEGPAS
eukprot:2573724-Rhodomonas_salina.1